MKNKIIPFLLIILFALSGQFVHGQDYALAEQHTWGGVQDDVAYSLAVTSDSLYLVGQINNKASITKFSLSPFQVLWSKTLNVISEFRDVIADDTGIYAVGYSLIRGDPNPIIVKFAPDGSLLWGKYYSPSLSPARETGSALSITKFDSLYCLTGNLKRRVGINGGIIACFYSNGNINNTYSRLFYSEASGREVFYPYGIAAYSSNLFLAGITDTSTPFIAKYDGTSFDMKIFPSPVKNITSITVDNSGILYITGLYGDNVFLAKIDSNLNIIYTKTIRVEGNERGYSIALDSSNNIYIGGRKALEPEAILIKLDNDGNLIWCKAWGGLGQEGIYKIKVVNEEIHAAGFSESINNNLVDITCTVTDVTISLTPQLIDTEYITLDPFTVSLINVAGVLDKPVKSDKLYLRLILSPPSPSCPPLFLKINEIEKINAILKQQNIAVNQILYFSLFTFISLTFLFSFMIIKNKKRWKEKQR